MNTKRILTEEEEQERGNRIAVIIGMVVICALLVLGFFLRD